MPPKPTPAPSQGIPQQPVVVVQQPTLMAHHEITKPTAEVTLNMLNAESEVDVEGDLNFEGANEVVTS